MNPTSGAPAVRLVFDALRGAGALVVFAAHAAFYWLDAYATPVPAMLLHAADLAVITFFVVSGFVIVTSMQRRSAASDDGRLDLVRFARDRAWRLLPPLAVALLVTTLCHALTLAVGPPGYEPYWNARLALGVVLFLQGLVGAFDVPLANGPLWSLAHEGWFYVAGAALFARHRHAPLVVGLCVLALGAAATFGLVPAALVGERGAQWLPGFAVWCAGGALAFAVHGTRLPALEGGRLAAVAFLLSAALAATALAEAFAARYAFGLALAALLGALLPALATTDVTRAPLRWLGPLAAVAPFSYTLYVLHFPLVQAWNVVTDHWQQSAGGLLATGTLGVIGIVGFCAAVGLRAERIGRSRR